MKIWSALLVFVLMDALGDVFVSKGMKQVGEVTTLQWRKLLRLARRALSNPMLGFGILCMTVSFSLFLALLSWTDVSFVLPMTAPSHAIATLGAQYILKERVTAVRWIGTIFICIGIALISLSAGTT